MIKFQKFVVKDIAFLAIMAALLVLCAGVTMPLMSISLFGLRNMATAIFYGAFISIALLKVRKPGTLSILGVLNAAVLMMMSPVMFVTNAVSAVLTEIIILLIFKSYDNDKAILGAASLMIPMTLPFTIVFAMIMNGQSFNQVVEVSPLIIGTVAGTIVLSILGTMIGSKLGRELKKAGKL